MGSQPLRNMLEARYKTLLRRLLLRCYMRLINALLLPCFIPLLPHLRHIETPIVSDGK